jgi:hypothetical protein
MIASPVVFSQGRRLPKTKARTSKPQVTPKSKDSKVKDEAYDEIVKAWDRYFLKCGDSFYCELPETATSLRIPICEYRFVSITIQELPLNEPDRLNGIERKFVSKFIANAGRCYRVYYHHDYPDAWEDWSSGIQKSFNLIKKSGNWIATPDVAFLEFFPPTRTKISCSNIPGDNKRLSLNLDKYCGLKYGDSAVAVNTARDAYSWRCKVNDAGGNTRYFEMDMDEVCQGQYGSDFKAAVDEPKDFASWHCIPK